MNGYADDTLFDRDTKPDDIPFDSDLGADLFDSAGLNEAGLGSEISIAFPPTNFQPSGSFFYGSTELVPGSTATFDNFSDPLEFNSFHIGDAVAIPESAIEAMKAWAEDRGYSPTMDQMKTLAKNTNINLEQVKQWFKQQFDRIKAEAEEKQQKADEERLQGFLKTFRSTTSGGLVAVQYMNSLKKHMGNEQSWLVRHGLVQLVIDSSDQIVREFSDGEPSGVLTLNQWLRAAKQEAKEEQMERMLTLLDRIPMTIRVLQQTDIGKTVKKISAYPDNAFVSSKAHALVDKWKALLPPSSLASSKVKANPLSTSSGVAVTESGSGTPSASAVSTGNSAKSAAAVVATSAKVSGAAKKAGVGASVSSKGSGANGVSGGSATAGAGAAKKASNDIFALLGSANANAIATATKPKASMLPGYLKVDRRKVALLPTTPQPSSPSTTTPQGESPAQPTPATELQEVDRLTALKEISAAERLQPQSSIPSHSNKLSGILSPDDIHKQREVQQAQEALARAAAGQKSGSGVSGSSENVQRSNPITPRPTIQSLAKSAAATSALRNVARPSPAEDELLSKFGSAAKKRRVGEGDDDGTNEYEDNEAMDVDMIDAPIIYNDQEQRPFPDDEASANVQISKKTGKLKKSVSWAPDDELEKIKFFVKDSQRDESHPDFQAKLREHLQNERAATHQLKQQQEQDWRDRCQQMKPSIEWNWPPKIDFAGAQHHWDLYGAQSKQAEEIRVRDDSVLMATYIRPSDVPARPAEPIKAVSSREFQYDDMNITKISFDTVPDTPQSQVAPNLSGLTSLLSGGLVAPTPSFGGYVPPPTTTSNPPNLLNLFAPSNPAPSPAPTVSLNANTLATLQQALSTIQQAPTVTTTAPAINLGGLSGLSLPNVQPMGILGGSPPVANWGDVLGQLSQMTGVQQQQQQQQQQHFPYMQQQQQFQQPNQHYQGGGWNNGGGGSGGNYRHGGGGGGRFDNRDRGSSNEICRQFNTPNGCNFGDHCRFRHEKFSGRDRGPWR